VLTYISARVFVPMAPPFPPRSRVHFLSFDASLEHYHLAVSQPLPGLTMLESKQPSTTLKKTVMTVMVLSAAATALFLIWIPHQWWQRGVFGLLVFAGAAAMRVVK
jgi:hypothetical protein